MQSDSKDDGEDEDVKSLVRYHRHHALVDDEELEPNCETDESFRSNESLPNGQNPKSYQYVTLPKPVMNKILIDAKSINKRIKHFAEEYAKYLPIVNNHAAVNMKFAETKRIYSCAVMSSRKRMTDSFH